MVFPKYTCQTFLLNTQWTSWFNARFEVLTVMLQMIHVFQDVLLCCWGNQFPLFGRIEVLNPLHQTVQGWSSGQRHYSPNDIVSIPKDLNIHWFNLLCMSWLDSPLCHLRILQEEFQTVDEMCKYSKYRHTAVSWRSFTGQQQNDPQQSVSSRSFTGQQQ